jgi:hypothetical protein
MKLGLRIDFRFVNVGSAIARWKPGGTQGSGP